MYFKTWEMKTTATVVFLNFVEDSENIQKELRTCFATDKEYVYYDRKEAENLLESATLTKSLVEKKDRGQLIVSGDNFVFAFYLDMVRTNKTMVDRIHELMKDFSENLHPGSASQIKYILCYRQGWENTSSFTLKELQESVRKVVINTVHAEYLLYGSMFTPYKMQEEALVRYLHMLSRNTDAEKMALSYENGYLCAFAFEKYDGDAAKSNDRQIHEYNNWLHEEKDQHCRELCGRIVEHAKGMVKGYCDLLGEFEYWQKLFPRKADDYKRVSVFWHVLNSTITPHIEEEREKYKAGYLEQLGQEVDWDKLKDWIRKNITYHDFVNLRNEDTKKEFFEDTREALQNEYKDPGYQQMEQAILELYEKKIIENLEEWEEWHRVVEEKLQQKQEEARSNGKYTDMAQCLANIKGNVRFPLPPGISPQGHKDWLMLKERFPEDGLSDDSKDNSEEFVCLYPDLKPCKVQMVSIVRYNPEDQLIDQVLKKGEADEGQDHNYEGRDFRPEEEWDRL